MTNQQFLTKFLKDIVHNPMDRQRILDEAVADLEQREAEMLQGIAAQVAVLPQEEAA